MLDTPFPPWPSYSAAEIAAVTRVLQSGRVNYWTGDECRVFEREFAAYAGTTHAIALTNGTVALELALRGLGIGPGCEVIVTPRTFVASASCIVAVGAIPVFADVDGDTQTITAATISAVVTPRTKAIICVHLAGMPCDMDPIMELARQRGLFVIEDCAQAHGATYKGRAVGGLADVGAWSFCQDKIMTTGGEGGMVTTSDDALWSRMWSYKDHGKSWSAVYERKHPPGYRWLHETFGTNWRMIEMQAVIGRLQLAQLPEWQKTRAAFAHRIWAAAAGIPGLRVPVLPSWAGHAGYRCYVFADADALRSDWSRDRIVAEVSALGVPCFTGTCAEVYLEAAFDGTPWRPSARLPVAQHLGETSIAFLVHPTLRDEHIDATCRALAQVMTKAVR